jgi:3-hydroxyacyl-[acyl-carrier-protein] dehydratase
MKKKSPSRIDIQEIFSFLPHRFPFLLVDRILELEKGKYILGLKNVTYNEPYFLGHFPSRPIMPGVLIIEAMAQVGAVLASKTEEIDPKKKTMYFLGIDKARFRQPVTPGDTLKIRVEVLQRRPNIWRMKAIAEVEQKKVAEAELLAGLTEKN